MINWQPWNAPSPWAGLWQAGSRPMGPVFRTREGKKIPTGDPKPGLGGREVGRSQLGG